MGDFQEFQIGLKALTLIEWRINPKRACSTLGLANFYPNPRGKMLKGQVLIGPICAI